MWFLSGHYCVIPFRSIHSPEIERTYNIDDNDNHYYETEMDSYQPIQPVNHDHGVCTFPVTRVCSGLNSHILQVRHLKVPYPSCTSLRKIRIASREKF